jgi:hypothetical protein
MGLMNTSKYGIAMSVAIALALSTSIASAQGKKAAPAPAPAAPPAAGTPAKSDDKVDISDLESKYWAPKDTDFSVVQNRTYSKVHAFFLTPSWGRPINDSWSEGNLYALTGNYFWSERFGVQASYIWANLHEKENVEELVQNYGSGVWPDHGTLKSAWDVGFNIVPFYAKMSFWGKRIIYFDMAFTPHVGMTQYDQRVSTGDVSKSAFTYGIDVTQYFFFTKWFAIRADLKNQWHNEEIVKYYGTGGTTGTKVQDKNIQDTLFLIGASFYW